MRTDTWARLPGSYHGSGCTLASAIAAMLANGLDLPEAVREAQDYTWHTLKKAYRPGMGQFLPDRLFWAREDAATPGDDAEAPPRRRCRAAATDDAPSLRRARARRLRGLYAVTPDLADTADLVARVEAALAGGAGAIQYRNKTADAALRRSAGRALARVTRGARRAVHRQRRRRALRAPSGADGVHLGEDDGGIAAARAIVGPERIIGVSCYNDLARAEAAVAAGADYVAFGSFFPSRVKPDARRADVALLARARDARRAGRRDRRHHRGQCARAACAPGRDAVAVISAVFDAPDVTRPRARAIARRDRVTRAIRLRPHDRDATCRP